ncbi:hypothetical protein GX865_02855 [Candidatus Saccharibacteria bacterium]|jgi:hypothetical protein|nr:hypothetical protein [Candidatus Saccharibacteria bacterium]
MTNINIKKAWYHVKYRYPTREIITIAAIGFVIIWFIWGSVQAMQKNYELRRMVDTKRREAELVGLEMKMLEYEQRYLQSEEYKKLAVRQRLGYGDPGEKVLILPVNSAEASRADESSEEPVKVAPKPSNVSQWVNFLFGGNVSGR